MARKGQQKQLRRYVMPRAVQLPRKSLPWVTKPLPGGHPSSGAIALQVLVRDYLKLARNSKEARRIIVEGKILVDGRPKREPRSQVGLMDVIKIPAINRSYRVMIDHRGRLFAQEIQEGESSVKLCRVNGKHVVEKKRVQLTFHDGKNLVGDLGSFRPGDVAKISLPDFKITDRLPMEPGALAFVTGGKNTGRVGRIEEIKITDTPLANTVVLGAGEQRFESPTGYIFVVGREKPEVSIPGVGA